MIEGIIFDVDGTLVRLKIDASKLRAVMIDELGSRGFDVSLLNASTYTQTMIEAAMSQIKSGKVRQDPDELRSRLYSLLDALELGWNSNSSPIEGIENTLVRLREASLRLGVVTNSGRAAAGMLLSRYDLLKHFEFVLTRDDVSAMKPNPEGILRGIGMLRLPKDNVIYVGDSGIDVRAARAAGVRIAAVTSGFYSEDRLRQEGSDYIIGSVNDVFKLLSEETAGIDKKE